MRYLTLSRVLTGMVLYLSCQVAMASEWYCEPSSNTYDWQWFAPLSTICEDPNPKPRNGYFGSAQVMHAWFLRPDRAAIGVSQNTNVGTSQLVQVWLPNSVNLLFTDLNSAQLGNGLNSNNGSDNTNLSLFFPLVGGGAGADGTNSDVVNPFPGFQFNGIDDAYTETGQGIGHRLEFGHVHRDRGWMVSIIHGLNVRRDDFYGFDDKRIDQLGAAQGVDGFDGIGIVRGDANGDGIIDGNDVIFVPIAGQPGLQSILAIDGLLTVPVFFNDPHNLLLGYTDNNFNQTADAGNDTNAMDDPAEDTDGDGDVDAFDRVRIAVVFDDMAVRNRSRMNGIELHGLHRKRRLRSGFDVEGYLGVRYLSLDDEFSVLARGGALADTSWDNNADNRIVGPSLGFRASRRQRQWMTSLSAKFMAGANFMTIRQRGTIGDHLAIGAPGVPLAFGGNDFFHRLHDERFSPVGEFRADAQYQITNKLGLHAGWTGMVVGNIARASNTVIYNLPHLGIRNGREEMFAHSLSLGIELNR